jgi:hypothetical protein
MARRAATAEPGPEGEARSTATEKRRSIEEYESPPPARKNESTRTGGRGKVTARFHDRTEDYCYITEGDLREVVEFGYLNQALIQAGTFFFSGGFGLFAELVVREADSGKRFSITPWMGTFIVSMVFGAVLAGVGWLVFLVKQKKIRKYFPVIKG